ncbi:MAG: molybdopterin molybdotransferase MoeA [bacterium]
MLKYKEAVNKILENISLIPKVKEQIKLADSLGRILAEDIISDINLPPFTNSAMDGYAIKYHPEIRKWKNIAEISAGNYRSIETDFNSAVRIMTGAKLPEEADTVIPVEDCIQSDNSITVPDDFKLKKFNNTRIMGEDLKINSVAISSGTIIEKNNINLAAACGKSEISVYGKLTIGVIASGDELIPIEQLPVNDQIRSSNAASIIASIKDMQMKPVDFGIVADKPELMSKKIKDALNSGIDILITTGGVSVGKYDFMQDAIKSAGAEIQFWKVNIKPGKPLLFSTYNNGKKVIPIFGLPGNPVSCFVNFKLFVKNILLMHYGVKSSPGFQAKLKSPIKKHDNRLHFVMAKMNFNGEDRCFEIESAGSQSSGTMSTMSNSDCMFLFPEELTLLNKGEWVECIRI